MAWIEFHPDELLDSQKFQDFRVKMSWTENEALGFLGRFWGKVLKLREAGDISGWRPDYVARLTDAKAHPEALWEALRGVWVDEKDGKLLVHDWLTYAGPFLRSRYKTRNKERLVDIWALYGKTYRGAKDEDEGRSREGPGKEMDRPPNRTEPDLTKPTKPTEPDAGQPVDLSIGVRTVVDDVGKRRTDALREVRLLDLQMPFGERKGVAVVNLEPDYCAYVLEKCPGIGQQLKDALRLRVRLKTEESNGAKR